MDTYEQSDRPIIRRKDGWDFSSFIADKGMQKYFEEKQEIEKKWGRYGRMFRKGEPKEIKKEPAIIVGVPNFYIREHADLFTLKNLKHGGQLYDVEIPKELYKTAKGMLPPKMTLYGWIPEIRQHKGKQMMSLELLTDIMMELAWHSGQPHETFNICQMFRDDFAYDNRFILGTSVMYAGDQYPAEVVHNAGMQDSYSIREFIGGYRGQLASANKNLVKALMGTVNTNKANDAYSRVLLEEVILATHPRDHMGTSQTQIQLGRRVFINADDNTEGVTKAIKLTKAS